MPAILMEEHSLYSLFKLHWLVLCIWLIYLYTRKITLSHHYSVTGNQITYFFIAILLLIVLKASPIDVIGKYYLFSAHVLQLAFIFFIAVPLFILSLPRDFFRKFVWNYRTRFFVTLLTHPWISLFTFNGLLSIYLIPAVFNFLQQYVVLHAVAQFILFILAIFMWFVIIQPVPELNTNHPLVRAAYIFFASILLMPIGFYFVLVQKAHFPLYYEVEQMLTPLLTAIYDQQLAGGILKITQMFSYAFALLFITLEWGRREFAKEGTVDDKNIRYVRGVVVHLHDRKNNR